MNAIQYQAAELKQTLLTPDTGKIYVQAFVKTWKLIQQLAILVFFLTLLLVAVVIRVWSVGFQNGQKFRTWVETKATSPQMLLMTLVNLLLSLGKNLSDWADSQIHELIANQDVKAIVPTSSTNLITPTKVEPINK
jgi:hypothetical protein